MRQGIKVPTMVESDACLERGVRRPIIPSTEFECCWVKSFTKRCGVGPVLRLRTYRSDESWNVQDGMWQWTYSTNVVQQFGHDGLSGSVNPCNEETNLANLMKLRISYRETLDSAVL